MTFATPRALVLVNGSALTPTAVEVQMSKTQKSDTFHAEIPLGALPAGMDEGWWSTANNITVQVQVSADEIAGYVQIFDGKVDRVDFDFAGRLLSISGRDKSAALIDATSTEKFNNQQPDQIVQTIAGRHGIAADTDSVSAKAGKIFQFDYAKLTQRESEWTVIQRLADHFGMVCYATGGKLYWKSYPEHLPTLSVIYVPPTPESPAEASFVSLRGTRNVILGRPVKVSVKSWNHKEKKLYQSDQTEPGSGDTLIYNYQEPGLTGDQVERISKKRLAENTSHEFGFELEMPGDPTVTPRFMLELSGTGTAFDQQHEIKSVEHRISFDEGYLMTISAKSKSGKRGQ
ncbi:MAG: phage late control D family protein [Mesorhizobium sp.]